MAKITGKKINAINAKCSNGFHFDVSHFRECGGKELYKLIVLKEDAKMIEVRLNWEEGLVRKKNENGCSVPHYTGKVIPRLYVTVLNKSKTTGVWMDRGGNSHSFKESPCDKRKMEELCKTTPLVTNELIASLLSEQAREEFAEATSTNDG